MWIIGAGKCIAVFLSVTVYKPTNVSSAILILYRNTSKRLKACQRIVVRLALAKKISKASGVPRFENWGVSELF